MSQSDRAVVAAEYATEERLAARASVYRWAEGPDAREVAFEAVRERAPQSLLEAGCGEGWLAERVARELGAEVVAIDLSPRMVELARARGVDARVGDVRELPFADGSFECAAANWMLYHVDEIERALRELHRVLVPGGRLVAATVSLDHLGEVWSLVGRDRSADGFTFTAENGEELLRGVFPHVERRDVVARVRFPDRGAVAAYVGSSVEHRHLGAAVPALEGPFVAHARVAVFVAGR